MIRIKFPVIETERLVLRKPVEDDALSLFEICKDVDVMRFYGKPPYTEIKQAQEEINWFLSLWKENKGLRWVISLKDDLKLIGDIGYYARANGLPSLCKDFRAVPLMPQVILSFCGSMITWLYSN